MQFDHSSLDLDSRPDGAEFTPELTFSEDSRAWRMARERPSAPSSTSEDVGVGEASWEMDAIEAELAEDPALFNMVESFPRPPEPPASDFRGQAAEAVSVIEKVVFHRGKIALPLALGLLERRGANESLLSWFAANASMFFLTRAARASFEIELLWPLPDDFAYGADLEACLERAASPVDGAIYAQGLLRALPRLTPRQGLAEALTGLARARDEALAALCSWDEGLLACMDALTSSESANPDDDLTNRDMIVDESSAMQLRSMAENIYSTTVDERKARLAGTSIPISLLISLSSSSLGGLNKENFERACDRLTVARNHVVVGSLYLVENFAKRFAHDGFEHGEVLSECSLAIINAIDRFKPALGKSFIGFAWWSCRARVQRANSQQALSLRLPAHIHDQLFRPPLGCILNQEEYQENYIADRPSNPSVAYGIETSLSAPLSVDQFEFPDDIEAGEECQEWEGQADPRPHAPDELLSEWRAEAIESRLDVCKALLKVRSDLPEILIKRFGLAGQEQVTLEELGESRGLTRERIRQLEFKALKQMRAVFEEDCALSSQSCSASRLCPQDPKASRHACESSSVGAGDFTALERIGSLARPEPLHGKPRMPGQHLYPSDQCAAPQGLDESPAGPPNPRDSLRR